ncbi:MAG: SlyX family protein [Planctomycetota bacterium]
MQALEEKIAHLEKMVDELSQVVAVQGNEIAALKSQVRLLMQREANREAEGAVVLGDERPPHW